MATKKATKKATKLKTHEIEALEKIVRKAVKRDDSGFRKDVSDKNKAAAKAALKTLGRNKVAWDRSIHLGYVNTAKKI